LEGAPHRVQNGKEVPFIILVVAEQQKVGVGKSEQHCYENQHKVLQIANDFEDHADEVTGGAVHSEEINGSHPHEE